MGLIYEWNDQLTLRAGFNHGDQPVPRDQTFFYVFAPAIVKDHLTLGATWKLRSHDEVSLSYFHAFEYEVKGQNSIPNTLPYNLLFGGGEVNYKMKQDSIGIAYSLKL